MEEKLKNILSESARIFRKYGLKNISMDDICLELGISKKTLYQYVSSKADLVEKVLNYQSEASDHIFCSQPKHDKNAIDILLDISLIISKNMKEFSSNITFELQKYYPEIYRNFLEKKRKSVFEGIKANLEKGIEEGLYREDLDIDLIARFYIQKLVDVHSSDFLSNINYSFEKIFLVMFESHIRGIANTKGLAYFEKKKAELMPGLNS